MGSRIELEETAGQVQTSLDRPLAGQSAHVFNFSADLDLPKSGAASGCSTTSSATASWMSGSLGMPDIYESGRGVLDAVFRKRFASWSLRAAFDNLLDSEHEFTQGGRVQRVFRLGRSFSLSLSWAVR